MAKKPAYEELEKRLRELEEDAVKYKEAENRVKHLNLVLRAIQNVNQLITREKDPDKLLQGTCNNLIETRGYHNVWIALFDEFGKLLKTVEAGLGEDFLPMLKHLKRGELNTCGRTALLQSDVVITEDPSSTCYDCPLAGKYSGRGAMTIRLEHDGKVYGLLSVSIPKNLIAYKEEQGLLREVAEDIAYALYNIELEDEHKRGENALRKSEGKYRFLVNNIPGIVYRGYKDWSVEFFDNKIESLTGYDFNEFNSRRIKWIDIIIKEDIETARESFIQALKTDKSYVREYRIKSKTEGITWIQERGQIVCDNKGEIEYMSGIFFDITERKRTQEERNRLEIAIEQAAESVFITDKDGMIQYVNPAFERLTGYSCEDAIGQNSRILKSGKHDALFYKQMCDTLTRGNAWHGRLVNRKKDGSFYEADATISPVLDKSDKITNFVSIKRDVTHEIELEKRLIQAQKMESIGTLAGGIAHDFNNILFSVFGYTEMALDDTGKGTVLHKNLQEVVIAAHRAKDLVKQILTFSRQADQELKPLKVQLVVREVLKLIKASLPSTIEINRNISNTCGFVMADATQVHQIAMNLLTNAYHAMEDEGGKLDVTLKEVDLDVDELKDPAMVPGSYVCLTVEDTGTGIDKSIIDRIFEPYFSTKEKGKGTGLGLAMVHGMVKSYGGNIRVYSEPGKGTAFHVYLPVIQTQAEKKEPRVVSPVEGGTERILLVDDEVQIVRMEQQMLERLGYHVTARTSSIEALEAFRAAPDKFDLIITDMTMPNMTGVELAKKIIEIRPDISMIICTGFSEKISADKAKAMGIHGYVMKPVVKSELAKKIRGVLDDKS